MNTNAPTPVVREGQDARFVRIVLLALCAVDAGLQLIAWLVKNPFGGLGVLAFPLASGHRVSTTWCCSRPSSPGIPLAIACFMTRRRPMIAIGVALVVALRDQRARFVRVVRRPRVGATRAVAHGANPRRCAPHDAPRTSAASSRRRAPTSPRRARSWHSVRARAWTSTTACASCCRSSFRRNGSGRSTTSGWWGRRCVSSCAKTCRAGARGGARCTSPTMRVRAIPAPCARAGVRAMGAHRAPANRPSSRFPGMSTSTSGRSTRRPTSTGTFRSRPHVRRSRSTTAIVARFVDPPDRRSHLRGGSRTAPPGYTAEGGVFRVSATAFDGSRALYLCNAPFERPASPEHYLSTDSACEGRAVVRLLGHVGVARDARTPRALLALPAHRCSRRCSPTGGTSSRATCASATAAAASRRSSDSWNDGTRPPPHVEEASGFIASARA